MQQAEFDQHPLWGLLDQAEEHLRVSDDGGPEDPAREPWRERLRYVISFIRSYKEIDALYFAQLMLDQAQQQYWTQTVAHLAQYAAGRDPAYLQAAAKGADESLVVVGMWPQPTAKGGAAAQVKKLFTEYVESARQAITDLRETNQRSHDAAVAQAAEHSAQVVALTGQLDQLRAEIEAQSNRVTAAEGRLDTALTANNEAFTAAQTTRQEKLAEWLVAQEDEFSTEVQPYLDELRSKDAAAAQHLEAVVKIREDTEKVAGLATGAVLARDYGSYSNREWAFGLVSYAFGFGVLLWTAKNLLHVVSAIGISDKISWAFVSLKLGITLTSGAAAAVAFALGSRFFQRAHDNKQVELELRAIGPFLADLEDPKEVQKAKTEFIARSFGRGSRDLAVPKDGETAENAMVAQIVTSVLAALKKS